MNAPKVTVRAVELYERDVVFRMPFRFGVVTLTGSPQAFVRARIAVQGGGEAWGQAAEVLAPKWFDKRLDLSNEDNFDQLRSAVALAREAYLAHGAGTAFGLLDANYSGQIAAGAARGLNPLTAGYGPALLDKAVLDGLCRARGVSFYQAIRENLPGIEPAALAPDLDGFAFADFLASLTPGDAIEARHTVGMVDPLTAADQAADQAADRAAGARLDDGLPETLDEVAARYGHRWYKIKVGGDVAADLDRLRAIAAVLDRGGDYRVSLDGNEQYDDAAGVLGLLEAMQAEPTLARFNESIAFIEQPIRRAAALDTDVSALAAHRPVIIDESDGDFGAYPAAKARGYAGVSSKSCKSLYKSLINAARTARWNAEAGAGRNGGYFMTAEDLTVQGGLALQQDLALVNLLGLGHVERNGHHYVRGMGGAGAPAGEQAAFAAAHPDLYRAEAGETFVRIENGALRLASLDGPGFASAAEPDWSSMRDMDLSLKEF